MKYILCLAMPNGYAFYEIQYGWPVDKFIVLPISRKVCLANELDTEAHVDGNVYITHHNLAPQTIVRAYTQGKTYQMKIENPMNLNLG